MAHFKFHDSPKEKAAKEAEAARLRAQEIGDRLMRSFHRLSALLAKANFNPNQPRVSAGNPDGGEWTRVPGWTRVRGLRVWLSRPQRELRPILVANRPEPPPNDPPKIPRREPSSAPESNSAIKALARWLGNIKRGPNQLRILRTIVEGASWLEDAIPYIRASLDPPKTLDELRRAALERKVGYEIHHIVERAFAEKDGFPPALVDGYDNRVLVPKLKHWQITGWFMTPNEAYGSVSPREYLRQRDWNERMRVGLDALVKAGVLKR